jgi:DNA-binding beta-propeller fold protein YncE
MRSSLAYLAFFGLTSLVSACSTPGASGDDTMGGDDGSGEMAPPFTNGTSTLAGSSEAAYVDGSRNIARFSNPVNVAFHDGRLYVADFDNGKVRVVDADGTTGTVIAQGGFARPFGMAFAPDGTFYVSTDKDSGGNLTDSSGTLWKVDISGRTATVLAANLGRPRGLAVLADGRIAVADYTHHVIELVDKTTGAVTQLAGTSGITGSVDGVGGAARFNQPYQLVAMTDGTLLVTDYGNSKLRTVALDGTVTTMVGSQPGYADGSMADASFKHPEGIAIDGNGDVYVSDVGNARVRRIHDGMVETIAGNGTAGYVDDDDNLSSELYGLEGLSVAPDGSMVYVADGNQGNDVPYNRVRQVKLTQ